MLIRILFILFISMLGLSPQHASAEWPTHIEKSVAPGGTVVIFKVNHYQAERGCTASPAGTIDGEPKPKLGTLFSTDGPIVGNGPCGKMEYHVQTISYKAGSVPGTDEFVLFIYPGGWPGGSANRINLKISIGGGRPAQLPKPSRAESGETKKGAVTKPFNADVGNDTANYNTAIYKKIIPLIHLPAGAPRTGKNGSATVGFVIDKRGHLAAMKVIKPSGVPAIDLAVVKAIRQAGPYPAPPNAKPLGLELHY